MNKKISGYSNKSNKRYWYINTYNGLGSQWLIDGLKKLRLRSGFTFVNLSANYGDYEKDAFLSLEKSILLIFILEILNQQI